jgi:hypothetical protein
MRRPVSLVPTRYGILGGIVSLLVGFGFALAAALTTFAPKPGESPALQVFVAEMIGLIACAVGASLGSSLDARLRPRFGTDDYEAQAAYRLALARRTRLMFWTFLLLIPVGGVAPCLLGFWLTEGHGREVGGLTSLVLFFAAIVATLLMWSDYSTYTRRLRIIALAERLGLHYEEEPPQDGFEWARGLRLWRDTPDAHHAGEVIAGEYQGYRVAAFQFGWSRGRGEHGKASGQTVYVIDGAAGLPALALFPRTWGFALTSFLGAGYEALADTPLRGRFYLLGDAAAAALLTPEVCDLCLARPRMSVEMQAGRLVLCVPGRMDAPSAYPAMLDHLVALATALGMGSAPAPASAPTRGRRERSVGVQAVQPAPALEAAPADDLRLRKVDRGRAAWLTGVPVAHVWAGRLDGFAITVVLARKAGERQVVYIVEGATLGVPPVRLTPAPPGHLGPDVAALCAARPELALEVGDATLLAFAEPSKPEAEPGIFWHLLRVAAALQQANYPVPATE